MNSVKEDVPDIREGSNSLTEKSRVSYEKQYDKYKEWCNENNIYITSEDVLLAYFEELTPKYKPTSLWTTFSMLRACLSLHQNLDITKYNNLQAFLKRVSSGFTPKQSKIFKEEDINKFIQEADDKFYLAMKVVLILGYNGACRREELTYMTVDNFTFKSDSIIVSVPKKNNDFRMFVVTDSHWIDLIKKYYDLRPKKIATKRFFLTYRNGHCVNSAIGINTMGKISTKIAYYLNLPCPELYTGHSFRRTSASHLGNKGFVENHLSRNKHFTRRLLPSTASPIQSNDIKSNFSDSELEPREIKIEFVDVGESEIVCTPDAPTTAFLPQEPQPKRLKTSPQSSVENLNNANDTEFIAKNWALKLFRLKLDQRIWAEKYINDILTEGELGSLHRGSVTFNL